MCKRVKFAIDSPNDSRRALEEDSVVLELKSGRLLAQLFVDVLKLVD
jgi:hypothetical protein